MKHNKKMPIDNLEWKIGPMAVEKIVNRRCHDLIRRRKISTGDLARIIAEVEEKEDNRYFPGVLCRDTKPEIPADIVNRYCLNEEDQKILTRFYLALKRRLDEDAEPSYDGVF